MYCKVSSHFYSYQVELLHPPTLKHLTGDSYKGLDGSGFRVNVGIRPVNAQEHCHADYTIYLRNKP